MIDGEPKPNRVQSLFEPTHNDSDSPLTPLDEPQKKRPPEAHAHTHNIRCSTSVLAPGPSGCTPHHTAVSHGMASAPLAVRFGNEVNQACSEVFPNAFFFQWGIYFR